MLGAGSMLMSLIKETKAWCNGEDDDKTAHGYAAMEDAPPTQAEIDEL